MTKQLLHFTQGYLLVLAFPFKGGSLVQICCHRSLSSGKMLKIILPQPKKTMPVFFFAILNFLRNRNAVKKIIVIVMTSLRVLLAPYFRIFNPIDQIKKFDKQHEYIHDLVYRRSLWATIKNIFLKKLQLLASLPEELKEASFPSSWVQLV